jgi:phosphoglycerate dehydrogenase-like enzyme
MSDASAPPVVHVALTVDAGRRRLIQHHLEHAGLAACFLAREALLLDQLGEIRFLLLGRPPRLDWQRATALQLIQIAGSGVDPLFPAQGLLPHVHIANARGAHADAVRDHVLAMLFAFARDLPRLIEQQRAKAFRAFPSVSVAGQTVCVVGLGQVGSRVARACSALGFQVVGVNAAGSHPDVPRVFSSEQLSEAVAGADYTVVSLPLTSRTRGLFDRTMIAALPHGSVLINVARGGIVDEAALSDALRDGRLRGAALDVFDKEPLLENSELWSCPRLLLTPHSAGYTPDYLDPVLDLFVENVRRVQHGEAPLNPVLREREY